MKTYLVGGAVRDELLGLPVRDRDWVVTGATPEQMVAAGFRPVGRDFPVFLHPDTHEEYALARTERKSAPGYRGFTVHADPGVTLEQDLSRRDLTINAMARDENHQLIDPYEGRADVEARLLRHVTPAFAEDPVRILRVARFAARFAALGFRVADETMALMRDMVTSGEVDALVAERVWTELEGALAANSPATAIEVLRECGALARILPEVNALFGVPQKVTYHPEIDTGRHLLMVLEMAARMQLDSPTRYACLVHDLGKALTPQAYWPGHAGHEKRGLAPVRAVNERLKVPKAHAKLALVVCEQHLNVHRAFELKPATVMKLIEAADGLRNPGRFERLLKACEADARGRLGHEDNDYPQARYLAQALAATQVSARPFVRQGLEGEALAAALRKERIRRIADLKQAASVPARSADP